MDELAKCAAAAPSRAPALSAIADTRELLAAYLMHDMDVERWEARRRVSSHPRESTTTQCRSRSSTAARLEQGARQNWQHDTGRPTAGREVQLAVKRRERAAGQHEQLGLCYSGRHKFGGKNQRNSTLTNWTTQVYSVPNGNEEGSSQKVRRGSSQKVSKTSEATRTYVSGLDTIRETAAAAHCPKPKPDFVAEGAVE